MDEYACPRGTRKHNRGCGGSLLLQRTADIFVMADYPTDCYDISFSLWGDRFPAVALPCIRALGHRSTPLANDETGRYFAVCHGNGEYAGISRKICEMRRGYGMVLPIL